MVGLVSVFLTVPEKVGDFFEKQQEIQKLKIENTESKQEQEFQIIHNTLAQQGTERVFVLRYLSKTLDDNDAKTWATEEVSRLDDLAKSQKELKEVRTQLESKQQELAALVDKNDSAYKNAKKELENLQATLEGKNSEISKLKQEAGLSDEDMNPLLRFRIEKNSQYSGSAEYVWIVIGGNFAFNCMFEDDYCERMIRMSPPPELTIATEALGPPSEDELGNYDFELFGSLSVRSYREIRSPIPFFDSIHSQDITYN